MGHDGAAILKVVAHFNAHNHSFLKSVMCYIVLLLLSYKLRPNCLTYDLNTHNYSFTHLQIQYIDRHHIISVTERNCFCWNLHEAEPKKVYQVKNLPDCSAVMNTNTVFMHTFEDPSIVQVSGDGGGGQSPVHVLYCLAGHKISAGELNIKGGGDNHHSNNNHNHNTSNNNSSNANSITHKRPTGGTRDSEPDVRLTRSYFHDYNDNKLTKSRTQISSACLLPLRRIMLVGTSDGLIRVVV